MPGAWPSLRNALRRHLQQFPAVDTGLSRSERQTLIALADGALPLRAAFRAANYDVEEAIFMGDLGWWYHIRTLITGPRPLLAVVGEAPDGLQRSGMVARRRHRTRRWCSPTMVRGSWPGRPIASH